MQPKLAIGPAGGPLEREADAVADRVMSMPKPVQDGVTQQSGRGSASAAAPALVAPLLPSSGKPLDSSVRAFFEPRFGRDFSQVYVHDDERAAKSAQNIGARAFAIGSHLAFAAGQYAPHSDSGRHLLAHELAHTIQQGHAPIQRCPYAKQQGITGLVNKPEKPENEASANPVNVAGLSQNMIQRSATWKGATVHETINLAEMSFGGGTPVSWQQLNGTSLITVADADGAIKVPNVTTSGSGANWTAKVDTVPAQEGSDDETVLSPGPWTKVVTKAQAGGATGLAACSGPGNSTFSAHGKPSDDSVYKANRRHENHHVADDKVAFDDTIGSWDKKLQDAKDKGTEFKGNSAATATAALWTTMGNTPQKAARSYRQLSFDKGDAFHATAAGGPMATSNPASNADCSTSSVDVTNPMP